MNSGHLALMVNLLSLPANPNARDRSRFRSNLDAAFEEQARHAAAGPLDTSHADLTVTALHKEPRSFSQAGGFYHHPFVRHVADGADHDRR